MSVAASAATYYPTGVSLGLSGTTLKAATDTASTTQANSYFATAGATTAGDANKTAIIHSIKMTNATAGNVTVEGHNGTTLIQVIAAPATASTLLFESILGVPLVGGFRITTSAATGLLVEYEIA